MILNNYIGLPYKDNGRTRDGIDCWGLARLYYTEQLNIELPSYDMDYVGETSENIKELILQHKENWQEEKEPVLGDLVLFNIFGEPTHIGVYVGDGQFLHVREGMDSVIERLANPKWIKRCAGYFRYQEQKNSIQITAAPHPLRSAVITDWTVEGTSVLDCVNFIKDKYKVSERLIEKTIIMVDGVPIAKEAWDSTIVKKGQTVTYKAVAGKDAIRMIAVIVLVVIAWEFLGPSVFEALGGTGEFTIANVAKSAWYVKAGMAVFAMASQYAAMALVNAVMPIRPPEGPNDPGSPNQMNLLSGASNGANPFGAIPVVLGKVRAVGMLGATPYLEALTDTNLLTTMIVWGFGPLSIEDICIGTNSITTFYQNDVAQVNPHEITLKGYPNEDSTEFNKLYGTDVQQQFPQFVLRNNSSVNVNGEPPWTYVTMDSPAEKLDLTFNFPEGMRQVVIKGNGSGNVNETNCQIDMQVAKYQSGVPVTSLDWNNLKNYSTQNTLSSAQSDYTDIITPTYAIIDGEQVPCYQFITYAMAPNGTIHRFAGDMSDTFNYAAGGVQPRSATMQTSINSKSWGNQIGLTNIGIQPVIPSGYKPIWKVTAHGNVGILNLDDDGQPMYTDLRGSSTALYNGLNIIINNFNPSAFGSEVLAPKVTITPGWINQGAGLINTNGATTTVWHTNMLTGIVERAHSAWGNSTALVNHAVWTADDALTFDKQGTANFPVDGYYTVTAAGDDQIKVQIGGSTILENTAEAYKGDMVQYVYVKSGLQTIRVSGNNSGGGAAAVGVVITYEPDGVMNSIPQTATALSFGGAGLFNKRKDPFTFTHRLTMPVKDRYVIRCRRLNSDIEEPTDSVHNYFAVQLFSVTGYTNTLPAINPKGAPLAKTAVRLQSSGKVNGSIEGINALVTSIAWDYDYITNTWIHRPTNNPASLFAHVLLHPANAYRLSGPSDFDLGKLVEWHNFCRINKYTFNRILTATQSVMSVLRDICAAGKASPAFVDGKWSVIVDKPRTSTVQYFTPHNSHGFESTKVLPKIPDCFRVIIQDESRAYQNNEIRAYNYGYAENDGYKITAGSFITNRTYTITKVGNTDWNTVAGTTGEIYEEGISFVAANAGTGTGMAYTAFTTTELLVPIPAIPAGATRVKAAEIFEELTLPGVTNAIQALSFARWHFAQLKLRPEIYSFNTDFEYLVCTRGDLIKVSHDIPQWGNATGRIKEVGVNTLTLTEPVYLQTGNTYLIRIRTNYKTIDSSGILSTTKNIVITSGSGWYDTITLSTSITNADQIEIDNIFMLGIINATTTETQDLIVLGIEPTGNTGAKITCVDYAPQIFTADLANDLLVYNANISPIASDMFKNIINYPPTIVQVISDHNLSEEISKGILQNVLIISFATPVTSSTGETILIQAATTIEIQIALSDASFSNTNAVVYATVPKTQSSYIAYGLQTDTIYKIRARYTNGNGNIIGPWSEVFFVTNNGNNTNTYSATGLYLDLEDVNLVAQPINLTKPRDFDHWEFKIYKNSGSADFWDITPTVTTVVNGVTVQGNYIQSTTGYESGRFDLRNQPKPVISTTGIEYRVACRAVDRNGNYSSASTITSILVKTIQ